MFREYITFAYRPSAQFHARTVKRMETLKIICQENLEKIVLDAVIYDTKRIMLLKTASKNSHSFKYFVNLVNVEAFFVHELPP